MDLDEDVRRLAGSARHKLPGDDAGADAVALLGAADGYLAAHRGNLDDATLLAFGCLLAEVVVAELGGEITIGADIAGQDALQVTTATGLRCWPVQWTARAATGETGAPTLAMLLPVLRQVPEVTANPPEAPQ